MLPAHHCKRPFCDLWTIAIQVVILSLLGSIGSILHAQELDKRAGVRLERVVQLPSGAGQPAIVVTEFHTHGELQSDGQNLAVFHNNQMVPWKVLQVGPGDFCRVAFQPVPGGKSYRIAHGGRVGRPGDEAKEEAPTWKEPASAGLLLETHRWKACDLNSLTSVQTALAGSERIGSDYVPTVSHRFNPFSSDPAPFLSVYRGTLQIDTAGVHQFFTSSQDASFLLIDGKHVVAAPGAHGPVGDARIKGEVNLSAGPHPFEYYHAAAGHDACMVAAWQPPKASTPELIPAKVFGGQRSVLHLAPGAARHPNKGLLPEFAVEIVGEVPLVDSDEPLVRAQFHAARATSAAGRLQWDFGDGQTSDLSDPVHVYLHPGIHLVKLTVKGNMTVESANRVQIHRAIVLPDGKKRPDQLDDYLTIFQRYDSTVLKPLALLQVVRGYDQLGQTTKAARFGKVGLLSERVLEDEEPVHALVKLVGPMLRDRLDDSAGALEVWQAAVKAMRREQWKAECELAAVDICLADLDQRKEARALLDSATARLKSWNDPALASQAQRLWGDWYARIGDRQAARTAYERSMTSRGRPGSTIEQNAWRGAVSRSTEAFLRDKQLDRALEELRRWQDMFPTDKIEGHLPLLQAQLAVARGKLVQPLVLADDLVVVNPVSPYADRLVFLAAECAEKLHRPERARAGYQALVADYPGSPLVAAARQKLNQLGAPPLKK
jgi:tetratricopeptide (TPR) repeat protein